LSFCAGASEEAAYAGDIDVERHIAQREATEMEEDSCEPVQRDERNTTESDDAALRAVVEAEIRRKQFFHKNILSRTNWFSPHDTRVIPGTPTDEVINCWRKAEDEVACFRGCIEKCKCYPGSTW
jgi:hypothetical protein